MIKLGTALIVFTLLIIWSLNLKNVWRDAAIDAPAVDGEEWNNFREELERSLSDIKEVLEKREEMTNTAENASTLTPVIDDENQLILDGILKDTVDLATSTATITPPVVTKNNCPEWINCMPTINDSLSPPRSCSIPPGCEGITQIAY